MFGQSAPSPDQNSEAQSPAPPPIQYEKYNYQEPRNWSIISKLKFLIPALFLIATIVLVGVIAKNYIALNNTVPSPTPAPTLIPANPEPTIEPIKFKKYFNIDQGFSFNYPDQYGVLECQDQGIIYLYQDDANNRLNISCEDHDSEILSVSFRETSFYTPLPTPLEEQDTTETKEEIVLVADESAVKQTIKSPQSYISTVTFSNKNTFYLIKIESEENLSDLETVFQSFEFITDKYEDWLTYDNALYSIKYPKDWSIAESETGEGVVNISKFSDFRELNTFRIEFQAGVTNAEVTASNVISSTKNLTGWVKKPSLNIKNLKKGTALILDGQFRNEWQTFIVLFYKNNLVQILWYDDLDRTHEEFFENMLASFDFKN